MSQPPPPVNLVSISGFLVILGAVFYINSCSMNAKADTKFGEVEWVEILSYPEDVLTRIAITPDFIEKNYRIRRVILRSDAVEWKKFEKALLTTEWNPCNLAGDYRWAIHIHTKSKEVHNVYIDRKKGCSFIDTKKGKVRGGLIGWLSSLR
jgi:hypothetical protein